MEYSDEDFLQISGLQHFKFCKRRWALIHLEQQWADNFRTVDGSLMHSNAHDKNFEESRGNKIITRAMNVFSHTLGVSGECDIVEFLQSKDGIALSGKEGLWQPYPIEYKRGSYNSQSGDSLQLCCQAMCLEEMLCCTIEKGALYFGETRRRMEVSFDYDLRKEVKEHLIQMHDLAARGHTPKVKPRTSCNACSLKNLCLPTLMNKLTVEAYIKHGLEEIL